MPCLVSSITDVHFNRDQMLQWMLLAWLAVEQSDGRRWDISETSEIIFSAFVLAANSMKPDPRQRSRTRECQSSTT